VVEQASGEGCSANAQDSNMESGAFSFCGITPLRYISAGGVISCNLSFIDYSSRMTPSRNPKIFLRKHSLSLVALAVVLLLIVLYTRADPATHIGSFFGNAIADWTGVLVTVVLTKFLYEKGSAESKKPKGKVPSPTLEFLREHSLTLFLSITGIGWVVAFRAMDPGGKWGQVVGNIVSEWTQILGLIIMTKRLMEIGSKA
jgi:hypothetical protein